MGSAEQDRLFKLVADNVQKIQTNVNQMHSILSQIGTPNDSSKLRDNIKQIQHGASNLVKETNDQIKILQNLQPPSNISEQKLYRIKKERLVNEFTRVLTSFQDMQRKEKEKTKIPLPQKPKNIFDDDEDEILQQEKFSQPQHGTQQAHLQADVSDVDFQILQEREEEMRRLETDITDVNQIFKDLASIIHEQGDVIDSIESNTEHAADNVESGVEQLRRARASQTSIRKKKLFCIIAIVVALVILVIILTVTLSNNKKS